jgi:hypothetical protein
MTKIHAGLRKLYKHDSIKADQWVFNRSSSPVSRRGFLPALSRMSAILGAEIVFSQYILRWMQESQGLWPLDQVEATILDYLSANYGPQKVGRRKQLSSDLLPP